MNYRRALILVDVGRDPAGALTVLRRVAPALERVVVLARAPSMSPWRFGARDNGHDPAASMWLDALRDAVAKIATRSEVQLTAELGTDALAALCVAEDIELLVLGSRSLRSAATLSMLRRRHPIAILWSEAESGPGPITAIGCIASDRLSWLAIGAFLREHADPSMRVGILADTSAPPSEIAERLQVSGIATPVDVSTRKDINSTREWLDRWIGERHVDLLVFEREQTALRVGTRWSGPVLLVPRPASRQTFVQRALDVPDLLDDGRAIRLRADEVTAAGTRAPLHDHALAFVSGGRVVATVTLRDGEAVLPAGLGAASLGVYRVEPTPPKDPLVAIERWIALIRPTERPLVLIDAEIVHGDLETLRKASGSPSPEWLAVRLRASHSCASIRARLRAHDLPAHVVDARTVLDEGEAYDVSEPIDPVRLARVASAMRASGYPVAAIVHRGPLTPLVEGFVARSIEDLRLEPRALESAIAAWSPNLQRPIDASSPDTRGHRVEVEMDNATARRWLLDAIAKSTRSLHLQVYMAIDDDVGAPVESALAEAAQRGVEVKVLVDSLHGFHGSYGLRNPLLDRLAARPGVELRTSRPLHELPSLTDLKQRDHRKIVVADGSLALVGGRNLSHEYYRGFDEVPLTRESTWRAVPWLDAGARIEGPAVASLETAFLEAWIEAGGAPFEVSTPPAVGSVAARVVVHHGLRDARTLETYLMLIDGATSHIHVVNGFPLLLEIQHALLRAIRRGVRVRMLSGHLTPTHDGTPFAGPWSAARAAATELVHSRMDPIVQAGGEGYLLALKNVPGWAPDLGIVHAHVHAKAMSVDGLRCAVGSANMDITASYWESEVLLLIDDGAIARDFEARIEALMSTSTKVAREDAGWQQAARRRVWMRHWPGVLSV